jgi:hypothetical protein
MKPHLEEISQQPMRPSREGDGESAELDHGQQWRIADGATTQMIA